MRRLRKASEIMKDELRFLLKETSAIALCLDIWSSRLSHGYLGVTAHFLDAGGLQRNYVLACPRFTGTHDAVSICELAVEVIEDYGIRDKVFYVGVDNAASMIKAFQDLSPGLTETNEESRFSFDKGESYGM